MSEPSFATGVLLKQAADGDPRAWEELVNRYTNLLWSVARSHRLDSADAADAVQTTWLRLVEHLDRIQDPERLAGWLVTTAKHECLKTIKRSGRERPHAPDGAMLDTPDPGDPVDTALIRDERDAELWATFERLSERCRQLLRVLMSDSPPAYEAASAMLGLPIGSIGPTRMRCVQKLRDMLDGTDLLPKPRRGSEGRG
jgi:RNA polymerase sigma factor (sigma-70 family)